MKSVVIAFLLIMSSSSNADNNNHSDGITCFQVRPSCYSVSEECTAHPYSNGNGGLASARGALHKFHQCILHDGSSREIEEVSDYNIIESHQYNRGSKNKGLALCNERVSESICK